MSCIKEALVFEGTPIKLSLDAFFLLSPAGLVDFAEARHTLARLFMLAAASSLTNYSFWDSRLLGFHLHLGPPSHKPFLKPK